MGLLTKPAGFTASTVTPAMLNLLQDGIFDWAGTTVNGQGSIDDTNVSTSAALNKTKIGDTALVAGNTISPGVQTITRPTNFSGVAPFLETGLGGLAADLTSGNSVTLTANVTTFNISSGKGTYVTANNAGTTLSTIGGIGGGAVTDGTVIFLVVNDTNTTVSGAGAASLAGAAGIRLRGGVASLGVATNKPYLLKLCFSTQAPFSGLWYDGA